MCVYHIICIIIIIIKKDIFFVLQGPVWTIINPILEIMVGIFIWWKLLSFVPILIMDVYK